jgi:hypothetical protein
MRNVGLLAFGVTSLVLVPAVLHELTAGPQQIAKLVEPGSSSLAIGDATIDVSADRAIVDPGDPVHVTLRATAPKAEKVAVGVIVLEQLGTYNGRVPQPPNRVMLETVTLDAAPGGGAAKELTVKLPGNRNAREMQLAQYAILVMPPRTAEKLDKLRRSAQREGNAAGFEPMESPSPRHGAYNELYYGLFNRADDEGEGAPAHAARLDVMTRPRSSAVAIRAPERAMVGEEITVVVQVTNPTKRRVPELTVQLQQPEIYKDDYRGLDFAQVSLSTESASLALGPRESKQVEFHLTAKQAGTLGLYASISCGECEYDERLNDGNLEAIDIIEAPRPAPSVAPVAAAY